MFGECDDDDDDDDDDDNDDEEVEEEEEENENEDVISTHNLCPFLHVHVGILGRGSGNCLFLCSF
jgi:hypothetical protein